MFRRAETLGTIHGACFGNPSFLVSNLFFADDSLVFFRAMEEEGRAVRTYLDEYTRASGQLINYGKSEIFFGKLVTSNQGVKVARAIGVNIIESHDKYLGLPLSFGRSKAEVFSFIRERVWN